MLVTWNGWCITNTIEHNAGTINYATGAVTFTLAVATVAAGNVSVKFVQELDNAASIPTISFELTEVPVIAKEAALAVSIGHFGTIEMRKKFGSTTLDNMLARELVNALNAETFQRGMSELKRTAVGAPLVSFTQPSLALTGISRGEQIRSEWRKFLLAIETASFGVSGGYVVSSIVAGRALAAMLAEHPDFIRNEQAELQSAHVLGTLDGIAIVREPRTTVLAVTAGYALTRGNGNFRDSLVYAPYLPITSLSATQNFNNPLQAKNAVATSNGFYATPSFTMNIDLV